MGMGMGAATATATACARHRLIEWGCVGLMDQRVAIQLLCRAATRQVAPTRLLGLARAIRILRRTLQVKMHRCHVEQRLRA
jgi:hypothetical protein